MSKRLRKKQQAATLARANSIPGYGNPGGATMYISPQQLQNIFAQTYYGTKTGSTYTADATMYSPGTPLMPQPGVDKAGLPVQFKFPIAYNTFAPDRTLGQQDIPSFQQLRTVAKLYSGITMCERARFDLIPQLL